jgi:hypothetical protein
MSQKDVTAWLMSWGNGNADAENRLMEVVYANLRKVARGRLRAERADHSLTPTALVHEAYIRLATYRDSGRPTFVGQEFASMIKRMPSLTEAASRLKQ